MDYLIKIFDKAEVKRNEPASNFYGTSGKTSLLVSSSRRSSSSGCSRNSCSSFQFSLSLFLSITVTPYKIPSRFLAVSLCFVYPETFSSFPSINTLSLFSFSAVPCYFFYRSRSSSLLLTSDFPAVLLSLFHSRLPLRNSLLTNSPLFNPSRHSRFHSTLSALHFYSPLFSFLLLLFSRISPSAAAFLPFYLYGKSNPKTSAFFPIFTAKGLPRAPPCKLQKRSLQVACSSPFFFFFFSSFFFLLLFFYIKVI